MELNLALVQMRIAMLDPVANMLHMEEFVKEAKCKGAELVVFPEDAICGPLNGQTAFVEHGAAYLARMRSLAMKYEVDLVPGSWTVLDAGLLFNQSVYIARDGAVVGSYRKINLWDTERTHITPGSEVSVFQTRFGTVGLIICWDLAFPAMFSQMVAQGVELVISPTYWSFTVPSPDVADVKEDEFLLIDSLCTARAFENNIVLAYCNAAGTLTVDGVTSVLSGRSQVTHPLEKVLVKSKGNKEELLITKVELDRTTVAPLKQV